MKYHSYRRTRLLKIGRLIVAWRYYQISHDAFFSGLIWKGQPLFLMQNCGWRLCRTDVKEIA